MGYQIGRSFAALTAAASFLVVIAALFLATISATSSDRSMPPGWFVVAAFFAMFVCASCFCMLAIFDIADRLSEGAYAPPTPTPPIESQPIMISESAPTLVDGHAVIDEQPATPPEEDRDAIVARRLAEYEASKKK